MSKKVFILSVPMLNCTDLKKIRYRDGADDTLFYTPASFPSIPMLEANACGDDELQLVAVMTDDAQGRCRKNFERMQSEISELGKEMGIDLPISKQIIFPHNETKEKQIDLFKKMGSLYDSESEIYIDLTYGTKMTTIGMFASLAYAEKIKNCSIKSIIYGKYAHDGSDIGELYDMRCLYELNMMVNGITVFKDADIDKLIDLLWS